MILYSPTTNRVVWLAGNGIALTSIVKDGKVIRTIHSAPLDVISMSEAFTNKHVDDFKPKVIDTWSDLEK